jgi:hypothetical protein
MKDLAYITSICLCRYHVSKPASIKEEHSLDTFATRRFQLPSSYMGAGDPMDREKQKYTHRIIIR